MSAYARARPTPAPEPEPPVGRHRRSAADRAGGLLDAVSRLGSVVTLAALVVVAVATGGLADGVSPEAGSAVSVTVDGEDRTGR